MAQMKIPIGPIHPALEEPIHFMFTVDGERVVGVDFRVGYNHRGIEKLAETKDFNQLPFLMEHICGICSYIHSTLACLNVEAVAGVELPPRAKYIRTVVLEMERIHSHLLWAGIAAEEIGMKTMFMYAWKQRELILDSLEEITGNRVNHGINRAGGVRHDIDATNAKNLLECAAKLDQATDYITGVFLKDPLIDKRAAGVGVLTKEEAYKFGAVGPTARSSGLKVDVRKDDPYLAYGELDFEPITWDSGDIVGRVAVRMLEIKESVKIIKQALKQMPEGKIITPITALQPGEAVSRGEAPRGEDIHYIRSNGGRMPYRYKVRAPTMANVLSVPSMFKDEQVADIPIIIASIDPCIGCMDRVTFIDADTGKSRFVTLKELRK